MSDEQQPDVREGAVTAHFHVTDKRGKNKDAWEPVVEQPTQPIVVEQVTGTVARIGDYMTKWLQQAFQAAALGDRVGWDYSMIIAQANNQQMPMWLIYAEVDGLAIGSRIPGAIMAPITSSYEEFTKGVNDLVESLRKQRQQQMQQLPTNGRPLAGPQ